MKKNISRILLILFTITIMALLIYSVFAGYMSTQDETREKLEKSFIEKLSQ